MAADIAQELEIIKSQAKGDDVKAAISSALQKCAAERGGYIVKEIQHGRGFEYTGGINNILPLGTEDQLLVYTQSANNEAKTSETLNITLTKPGILLASAMYRASTLTVNGSGWTTIGTSPACGSSQKITAFYKLVEAGDYSVKFTQGSSARLSAKLIGLYDVTGIDLVDTQGSAGINEITLTAKTGKKRLYLASSNYATSGFIAQEYWGAGSIFAIDEQRYSAFYDVSADEDPGPFYIRYHTYPKNGGESAGLNVIELDVT